MNEVEEDIENILYGYKNKFYGDFDDDNSPYLGKEKYNHRMMKYELKTHKPLEYYFLHPNKYSSRNLPNPVYKKLYNIKVLPLFKDLPKNGIWTPNLLAKRCEICGKDPFHNMMEIFFYMCENRSLCGFHLREYMKYCTKNKNLFC